MQADPRGCRACEILAVNRSYVPVRKIRQNLASMLVTRANAARSDMHDCRFALRGRLEEASEIATTNRKPILLVLSRSILPQN